MSIRVLIVDDTVVFRRAVADALAGEPGIEVAGSAANGKMALAKIAALQPDLVTLDIEMPEMNGIEVLEAMRAIEPKPGVVVLSSITKRGGELTMKALELGAFDFLTKPDAQNSRESVVSLRAQLLPIIRAFERRRDIRGILNNGAQSTRREAVPAPTVSETTRRGISRSEPPMVLIGVSTGGPVALGKVLPSLPADLGVPVFIVQHMPAMFTQPLAASLDAKSAIRVKEAIDGEAAVPNCAYIAPGGLQMKVVPGANREIRIQIANDPPENNCKPAVDVLFRSAALHFPGRAITAILTGMGNDGTAGLRLLKRGGCVSIAQDENSCVVFGMPREAIASGLVDRVEPLDRIAETIVRCVRGSRV